MGPIPWYRKTPADAKCCECGGKVYASGPDGYLCYEHWEPIAAWIDSVALMLGSLADFVEASKEPEEDKSQYVDGYNEDETRRNAHVYRAGKALEAFIDARIAAARS